jgi:hypothetical protein
MGVKDWSYGVYRHFQHYFSYIVSVSFIGGLVNEQEYPEKTTNLPHVSEQLYHIMLHRVYLGMSEIPTHNLNGDNHY